MYQYNLMIFKLTITLFLIYPYFDKSLNLKNIFNPKKTISDPCNDLFSLWSCTYNNDKQ